MKAEEAVSATAVHFRRIALVSSFQTFPLFGCISFLKINLSHKLLISFLVRVETLPLYVSVLHSNKIWREFHSHFGLHWHSNSCSEQPAFRVASDKNTAAFLTWTEDLTNKRVNFDEEVVMKKFFTSHFYACCHRTVWSFIFACVISTKFVCIPEVIRNKGVTRKESYFAGGHKLILQKL